MGGGVSDNCTKTTRKRHYLSLKPALQAHSPHSGFALYSIPVLLSPRQPYFELASPPGFSACRVRADSAPPRGRPFVLSAGTEAKHCGDLTLFPRKSGPDQPSRLQRRPRNLSGFRPIRRFLHPRRFRRNGIAVPAQRGHRSGATASPFRRNGIAVSRHLDPVSGVSGGRNEGGRTGRPGFLGDI